MKSFAILAAAIALLGGRNCHAGDSAGRYATYGVNKCWDYVVWLDIGDAAALGKFENWVGGYVTAYNRQTPDTITILANLDVKAAMEWLARWCRANPTANMDIAMQALTDVFHPHRYRTVEEATK